MNNIDKSVFEIISVAEKAVKEKNLGSEVLADVHENLKLLKQLLIMFFLGRESTSIKETMQKMDEANLDSVAESDTNDAGEVCYLLHRKTTPGEYTKSKIDGGFYQTEDITEWEVTNKVIDASDNDNNPTVSCWIPRSSVESIHDLLPNDSGWDEAGTNPHADKCKVFVKPGKYEIYQEIRA